MDFIEMLSQHAVPSSRLSAFAFLVAVCVSHAQELDPKDPAHIGPGVERAAAIVTGTFRVAWFYPWSDGWHYRGAIQVDDVLDGDGLDKQPIPFHWLERYGNSRLICDRISRLHKTSGVWLLVKRNGAWSLVGTAATFCGDSLPLEARGTVVDAIRRKRTRK